MSEGKTRIYEALARAEDALGHEARGLVTTAETGAEHEASLGVMNLVARGWAIKQQIQALEDQLKRINADLLEQVGLGHAVIVKGLARATLAERHTVTVRDPEVLRSALGDRFADLVREKVTYTPQPRLLEVVCSADEPDAEIYRQALDVKSTVAVTWRAE